MKRGLSVLPAAVAALLLTTRLQAENLVPDAPTTSAAETTTESAAEVAAIAPSLVPGEVLIYRLGWGLFSNAGELRIESIADETPDGPVLRVKVSLESKGLVDAVFPINTGGESVVDLSTGRPLRIESQGQERDRKSHSTTVFDYVAGRVVHTDHIRPHRSGTAELPDEPVFDIYVTMLRARTWGLEPGTSREVLTASEDDILQMKLTAKRADRIRVPAGTYDAVEIATSQEGELKGLFRKGGAVNFWISRGEHPQVVRIDIKTKLGTVSAKLRSIESVAAPAVSRNGF